MFLETVQAQIPVPLEDIKRKARTPWRERVANLNDAGDPKFKYIYAIDPKAPFESEQIGDLNFEKRVFSPDASLAGNESTYFAPKILSAEMTEKRAAAYIAAAKDRFRRCGVKNVAGDVEWKDYCVGDYVIVKKSEEYQAPKDLEEIAAHVKIQQQYNEAQDEIARLKQSLIEEQAKNQRSNGKKT